MPPRRPTAASATLAWLAAAYLVTALAGPAGAATTGSARCEPLVVERGGTYGGCYRSVDPAVAAVTISTSEPVRLAGARVEHAGEGVVADVEAMRLTVVDSVITALDPGGPEPVSQRAVAAWGARSVVIEHSRLVDGHGIWLGGDGERVMRRLEIRANESVDVGRYPHPEDENCCVQMVQLDKIVADGVVAWNHAVNHVGRSDVEDVVNLYGTRGRSATRPFRVHHNLVDGAYPADGRGRAYTGGGIMINDGGGAYVVATRNRVISTTNHGLAIVGGHDSYLRHNRVVSDGRADDGSRIGPAYAVGVAVWDASETGDLLRVSADRNVVGWTRGTDLTRNDWWTPACDPAGACDHNRALRGKITAADEQRERDAWWADVAASDRTVGPRATG